MIWVSRTMSRNPNARIVRPSQFTGRLMKPMNERISAAAPRMPVIRFGWTNSTAIPSRPIISSRNATFGSDSVVIRSLTGRPPWWAGGGDRNGSALDVRSSDHGQYGTAARSGRVPQRPAAGHSVSASKTSRLHVSRSSRTAATSPVVAKAPSSLSVSRMATGPPAGVRDEHEADVDRADRGRVVVEQPDGREVGLEVRDELLGPLAGEPAGDVAVARVEVAADADRPAVVEPRVAAGARPAHEEPALAVAEHEVRDHLLVGRVLLGVAAAHEEARPARRPRGPPPGRPAGRRASPRSSRSAARGTTRTRSSGSPIRPRSSRRALAAAQAVAQRLGVRAAGRLEHGQPLVDAGRGRRAGRLRRPPRWRRAISGAHRGVAAGEPGRVAPAGGGEAGGRRPSPASARPPCRRRPRRARRRSGAAGG